ncbi:MAG: hypothetical protein RI958_233 [Actinomycetota bacterium]|jgi:hypothetical protein
MQQRPTSGELLAAVAEVLERDIVPALSGPAQHQARVAASLVAIVEREIRLGAGAAEREVDALRSLVPDRSDELLDLATLRAVVAGRLRAGSADDESAHAATWSTLMAIVKDDLQIAKPGHDSWDGE